MSFGWWTTLVTWEIVECDKPSSVAVLDTQTGAPGTCYHTPFKGTEIFCLALSPTEWHIYTIHVSRLKNLSLTCLLPFIYTD
jgi:hypothetical protein